MTNGNSFSSSIIDFTNPFHLTNNYNPNNIFVSHILEGENYPQWSRAMTTTLSAKNKLSFVDEIAYSISYETTAQGMWDDLKSLYQNNAHRSSTISLYYTKLKSLWEELASYTPLPPCSCHTIDNCYVLYGYPPGHRLHQPYKGTSSKPTINEKNTVAVISSQSSPQFTQDQYRRLLSMLTEGNSTSSPSSIPLHTWIVDTGASDHMIFDMFLFHSSTHVSHIALVKLLNDSFASVTHIGYVFFNTYTLLTSSIVCSFFWIQFTFHQQTYYILSLFSDVFS
ncbi:hypothetical protein AMTRI_Chr06g197130 [Amborella trichopoda]